MPSLSTGRHLARCNQEGAGRENSKIPERQYPELGQHISILRERKVGSSCLIYPPLGSGMHWWSEKRKSIRSIILQTV